MAILVCVGLQPLPVCSGNILPCIPGGNTCSPFPACRQWTGVSHEPCVAFCSLALWLAAREVWLLAAMQGCDMSCLKSVCPQLRRCPQDWHFNWAGVFPLRSSHLMLFNIRLEGKAFSSEMDDYCFKWVHDYLMKWKTKNVFLACDLSCGFFFSAWVMFSFNTSKHTCAAVPPFCSCCAQSCTPLGQVGAVRVMLSGCVLWQLPAEGAELCWEERSGNVHWKNRLATCGHGNPVQFMGY